MHKLIDLCSFLFTTAFIIGAVLTITHLVRKSSAFISSTKSSLEKRGWKVSSHGVSVPVDRRSVVDREHYLDATQRGLSKAANASTFGSSPRISELRLSSSTSSATAARDNNDRVAHVEESEHRHHHRLHLFKRHMD
ncbi:hypothetical protein V8E53_004534 [Lactarius tabidus]|jgi:hypothetical protein